jgi:hypothetical protein
MAGYNALHKRVTYHRGPASQHQCVRCPAQAAEWATVHGEDGTDPWADYVPMCHPCHVHYDDPARHWRGKPLTAEHRAKIGDGNRGRPGRVWTPEQKAAVSASLKGRPSPTKGMKFSDETRARMRAAQARRLGR